MKKYFKFLGSFRAKVTLILIVLMVFSGAVGNYFIYKYSLDAQFNQLRDKLMIIAELISMNIDADTLLQIPLNREGVQGLPYKEIEKKILRAKDISPAIAYVYILKKNERTEVLRFLIDVHPGGSQASIPPALPGDCYNDVRFPELVKAFNRPSADKAIVADEWGAFLSGYAPIRNSRGEVVAVLGIDMSAKDVYDLQKEVKKRAILVLMMGIVLSVIFGIYISKRITAPIGKLVEGTRHIASGDLGYKVRVKGADEIGELAGAFNAMASKLSEARRTLIGYFYRAVQSLVRILEARDPYTKGHSDRVAGYSYKIATKMGLPLEKAELVKEAALLHDIGKLGVQELILNKVTDLNAEDRELIKRHTAIGEEILKPVSLNKEMLAVVRSHHERYDGTGYPDKLKGDEINILAAIVSAADSYDAMVSHRTYNKVLTKEEAIEQLRKNSGTQFNPRAVEAFLKVLAEEDAA